MSYLGNNTASGVSSRTPYEITATQGQTVFTVAGYNPNTVEVLRNGSRLGKADYAATDGVTVTLARGCAAGDIVTIVPNTEVGVSTSYTKTEDDALLAAKAAVASSNAWAATQAPSGLNLTDGASITWDGVAGQIAQVTLGGNRAIALPSGIVPNATYVLRVLQDATGGRSLAFASGFKFAGGVAPTLTSSASAVDVFTFVANGAGTALHCIGQSKDVK